MMVQESNIWPGWYKKAQDNVGLVKLKLDVYMDGGSDGSVREL